MLVVLVIVVTVDVFTDCPGGSGVVVVVDVVVGHGHLVVYVGSSVVLGSVVVYAGASVEEGRPEVVK
jgi:hypothetical protein